MAGQLVFVDHLDGLGVGLGHRSLPFLDTLIERKNRLVEKPFRDGRPVRRVRLAFMLDRPMLLPQM